MKPTMRTRPEVCVLNDGGDEAVEFAEIEIQINLIHVRAPRRRTGAIKKPAGTAAGILSFDFTKPN